MFRHLFEHFQKCLRKEQLFGVLVGCVDDRQWWLVVGVYGVVGVDSASRSVKGK